MIGQLKSADTCKRVWKVAGIRDGYVINTPTHIQSDNTVKDSFRHSESGRRSDMVRGNQPSVYSRYHPLFRPVLDY